MEDRIVRWEGSKPPAALDAMDIKPRDDGTFVSVIIVPCGHGHKTVQEAMDCQWRRCMKWRKKDGGEAQFTLAHRPVKKEWFTFFLPNVEKAIRKAVKKAKRLNLGLKVPHDF